MSTSTDTATTTTQAGPPPALVLARRRVLRPLVQIMLARGITYPYLSDLLKARCGEVADHDFGLNGKSPTDSRVSLVSGVHRKDVSRLRAALGLVRIWPAPQVVVVAGGIRHGTTYYHHACGRHCDRSRQWRGHRRKQTCG